jgi:hypothetical protein
MVPQTEEQHGQCVPLRFVEYGKEIGSARDHEGRSVAHHPNKDDDGRHHAPEITTCTARFRSTPWNNR